LIDLPFCADLFVARLLSWYRQSGRALPWRNTRDPYRIWLAEIMLQQTTVTTVMDYYRRFLEKFPRVEDLAAAPLEEVIDLWAGLGYYSRARNLHATAQQIESEYGGRFPEQVAALQELPGIGRSTAGAVAALAFEQPAPILDGNVRRVLCRLCALQEPPRSSSAEKQLWHWSQQLTPATQVHDYTQAIMDLGATLCTPRQPRCADCPVSELCQAWQLGLEQNLPLKMAKKTIPTRHELTLLIRAQQLYLVRRRPIEGFLGGLWEFPHVSLAEKDSEPKKLSWLLQEFGLTGEPEFLGTIEHLYSHFRLVAKVYLVETVAGPRVAERGSGWRAQEELGKLALHGAHKKVFNKVAASRQQESGKSESET
jgi:A/G-specific adenine glycosylase